MVAAASREPTAIQELSRRPPSVPAIAGVAVASSVWSTAAMNIGRNTARKRFRNSARSTRGATSVTRNDFLARAAARALVGAHHQGVAHAQLLRTRILARVVLRWRRRRREPERRLRRRRVRRRMLHRRWVEL